MLRMDAAPVGGWNKRDFEPFVRLLCESIEWVDLVFSRAHVLGGVLVDGGEVFRDEKSEWMPQAVQFGHILGLPPVDPFAGYYFQQYSTAVPHGHDFSLQKSRHGGVLFESLHGPIGRSEIRRRYVAGAEFRTQEVYETPFDVAPTLHPAAQVPSLG